MTAKTTRSLSVTLSGATGLVGSLVCSVAMTAVAVGAAGAAASGMAGMAGMSADGALGLALQAGQPLLIASVVLVTAAFALARPAAAGPALGAGMVLYVGMYAQPTLWGMYASMAAGYAAWMGLWLWTRQTRPAHRTSRHPQLG